MERQAKILVVDDEPDSLVILRHMLSRAGYNAVPAYGGADALRKLERADFDLIVTDLAMPEVSGIEVIKQVKKGVGNRTIPVLAVTAYQWEIIANCAGQAGCDGIINKPVDTKLLLREVERHLKLPRRA